MVNERHHLHPSDLCQIFDTIPGLVFTCDPDGELEFANRQVLEYFDRTLEQALEGKRCDVVHPDDLARVKVEWQRDIAAGIAHCSEQRLLRSDGVFRWFQLRASPFRDVDGRLLRWFGVLTDIEDSKRARESARSDERDLQLLLDGLPALVFTMTPHCEIGLVNRQVLEYFGKTREELLDWEAAECVHPEDLPRVRASLKRTLEHGEPHEAEERLRRADGSYRWFKPLALPERDAEGRIVRWFCLLYDIDDLKRAEESQRSLQARLARAAQIATVSQLAAAIAHEVRQPIASVIANAEACRAWLSASAPDTERALRCVEKTIRDGYCAGDVISRIRSLFKQAPPVLLPLNLNEVVAEVRDLLADDLRDKGVVVKTELSADLPLVAADRVSMQQVLVNLIRNAVESMEDVAPGTRQLSIRSWALNGEVTVEVTDTGRGISDFESVFEPFYTTKASGMGMGLPICKSILEGHGGRLWATSDPSLGATFGAVLRALGSDTT